MEPRVKLTNTDGDVLDDPLTCGRLVGKLLYLTTTKLDLNFVIHKLSQCVSAPHSDHMKAVMKVLQYVKGTIGQGLFFPASS